MASHSPRDANATLSPDDAHRDSFNLSYLLGPVYDILRHPKTKTPMAIAIYGDWGTGKTTAMRWLHGLLETWNGTRKRAYGGEWPDRMRQDSGDSGHVKLFGRFDYVKGEENEQSGPQCSVSLCGLYSASGAGGAWGRG